MIKDGPVYCDCCGTVKLAVVRGGKLIIIEKRNRLKHIVSCDLTTISPDARIPLDRFCVEVVSSCD